jgi:hypothetical protein
MSIWIYTQRDDSIQIVRLLKIIRFSINQLLIILGAGSST